MEDKRNFYKLVFSLVIPIALQNVMNTAVQSADVFMLGKVSEKVLSASSLGGQVNFVLNLFLFGLSSGAMVLCSQYWGKQETKAIETILGIAMRFALLASVCFTVVTYLFPEFIMTLLSSDEQVREYGVEYLRILCFCFIFMSITMVYLTVMRSIERVIVSTCVYGISLIVNIVGNVIFIFGAGPIPAMGIKGAAIATLIARIIELLCVLLYNKKAQTVIKMNVRTLFIHNKLLQKDYFTVSGPVIFNELAWGLGMAVTAAILGQQGSEAASANAIVQIARQLATVVSFGIASAAAIVVGKAIGEKRKDLAKVYASRLVKLSVIFGLIGSTIVLCVRPVIMQVMNLSDTARGYLSIMMLMMAVYVCFQSFNALMIVGVFRSGGDTRFGLIIEICGLWGGSVVLGFIAAFVLHLPVPLIFAVILCDEFIKLPFVIFRYKSYRWLNDITRET